MVEQRNDLLMKNYERGCGSDRGCDPSRNRDHDRKINYNHDILFHQKDQQYKRTGKIQEVMQKIF